MLGLTFSSKLDWGSYITSIADTTSKKIEALIRSIVSFSWGCFVIQPCMKYCCHICAGAPSCFLELLDKLQKYNLGLLVFHLLPLLNPWLVTEM